MHQIIDDRYRVDAKLGEGAQATVLRVHDLHTGRDLALKRLLPVYADKRKLRARFEAEARTLSALDHPNVVKVFDVATEGPEPYFVMEYVPGGSLVERLEREGPLPPRLAVAIALQVCHGLAAAHRVGVIHRDVKPHNVLVAADGTCKLTDFGIARMGDTGLRTRAGAALGTEGFMAPEQAADAKSVDVRADVYGVGMTLFVLLTGQDPWLWITSKGRPRVPEILWEVLDKATEDKPEHRHPNVQALAADLRERIDQLPPDPPGTAWEVPTLPTSFAPPPDDPLPAEPTMDDALDETPPSAVETQPTPPPPPPPAGALPGPAAERGLPARAAQGDAPPAVDRALLPLAVALVLFVTSVLALLGVVALGLLLVG